MNQRQFYQWFRTLQQHLKGLKKWQALGLAMLSYGIITARRAQASLIAEELPMFGTASAVERRIQRWIANPRIDVKAICTQWVRWVLTGYQGKHIYLLVDETKLADRIGCMVIALAYRQRAIPLAWRCYPANSSKGYPPEGQVGMIVKLLQVILPALPQGKPVILQADRGIGNSSRLMRAVQALGLHFLFRVQWEATFAQEHGQRAALRTRARRGRSWHASGVLFRLEKGVACHVHVLWHAAQKEPWCLATNMTGLTGEEYAMRVWQEESFRDLKSGGWQWQHQRSRNPDTIERWILAMTVAYTWCLSLGRKFMQLAPDVQKKVDCVRTAPKYCLFRMGLRYFKRMFVSRFVSPSFQIGPFHAPP